MKNNAPIEDVKWKKIVLDFEEYEHNEPRNVTAMPG